MATNHVIIGLGGTGGKIIREFRKRYFEENKDLSPHNNIFFDYIYVDSSEEDLNSKKNWKVLGTDISLSSSQKVSIQGISMNMLHDLNHYPNINSFISDKDVNLVETSLGKLIDAGIGGQRRRLGRLLFSNYINSEQGFNQTLESTVRNLTYQSKTADVHFHVVAGLAGGTGSGSIVDTIAQIRKKYPYNPNGTKYHLHLYLYVPENTIANASHNAGFYQANGYAALSELNAMSVDYYHPVDITGEKDHFGKPVRLLSDSPFEAAYLFSNTNENGRILDIAEGLPKMVADFLYHKTWGNGDNNKMKRLETSENSGNDPETDAANRPLRSRKFLSFGVTRIVYPETEIQEYLAYRQAQQSARQMLYNAWEGGIGFVELSRESVGLGFNDKIRSKDGREFLKLSEEYLTLSKPIVDTDASRLWKDISKTWQDNKNRFITKVKEENDRQHWFDAFIRLANEYFDNGFRTQGVKRFFEIHQKERTKYAKAIVRNIERYLFEQWSNGTFSILDIAEYLNIVEETCREIINDEIPRRKTEINDRKLKLREKLREITDQWNKIGVLGKLFKSKPENVFNEFAEIETGILLANTYQTALDYESSLVTAVIQAHQELKDDVNRLEKTISEINEEFSKEASARCAESDSSKDITVKQYNKQAVTEMDDRFIHDEILQKENSNAIRSALITMLGGEDSNQFRNLTNRIGVEALTDTMLKITQGNVAKQIEDVSIENPKYKVLNVNILEKLRDEFSEAQLKDFITSIVKSAKSFLQFDSQEVGKITSSHVSTPMTMLQLSLPKMEDGNNTFREKFIELFALACPGFSRSEDVSESEKPNEITVIAAKSGFPLRHVANVKTCKTAYDKLVGSPGEGILNRFVLHTESFEDELPSLFEMNKNDIGTKYLDTLLLALGMGLIAKVQDPSTQRVYMAAKLPNKYGDEDYIEMGGNSYKDVLEKVKSDLPLTLKIKESVDKKLKEEYRSNDSKSALRDNINKTLKEFILMSFDGNPLDPEYKLVQMARNEIFDDQLQLY